MRADVLVARGVPGLAPPSTLYTYAVPAALAGVIAAGQLVAVPFGARTVPGIVWALDASDDLSDASASSGADIRPIGRILLPEPLILPHHRALAEWIADHYAAPLAAAARLMLPPGLLAGLRTVVRPAGSPSPDDAAGAASEMESASLPGDGEIVLAMAHERAALTLNEIARALGATRARAATRDLIARGQIVTAVVLPPTQAGTRRDRIVRLLATPDALDAWRAATRARLDTLPPARLKRPSWQRAGKDERQAERLLRQLAALDALAQPPRGQPDGDELPAWRFEELRRLTRVTPAALEEIAAERLIVIEEVEVRRDPLASQPAIARSEPLPLTAAQAAARDAILDAAASDNAPARPLLLHGITGSGKTEVYLQALAAIIARGRRGLVLVPEIALTPQAVARFAGRFPGRVALLHSGLTPAERLDEWRRIRTGAVDVVVGSRSALFAPLDRLGLIVVDEEHEAAYKEEQRAPTYHARDTAVALGRLAGAAVVLGSATPSVESYHHATHGAYTLIELSERAPAHVLTAVPVASADPPGREPPMPPALPAVTLIDLRAELRAGNTSILSEPLHTALQQTLDRGEQAILFLNRRGTASCVVCRECGYVARCRRCDVSMTFHAPERALLCHYCGKREPAPATCPVCRSAGIRYFGIGTERVEAAVKRQFPTARVLRWDRDTARTRHVHEQLLRAFSERRADILVGTQMIAKGLDLPAVTLVGVVSADVALFLPDFRASERAFQLLTQVAGRAGRGALAGRVLVQTFNPEHFCVQAAAAHDYRAFYEAEASARGRFGYPPFRRFVKYTFAHADRYTAQIEATVLGERLERLIRVHDLPETDLVGPAPAFMERLRGAYRWQLILRSPDPRPILRALASTDLPRGWSVDVDPASTL
jgi:primosomal protein N' (replication factor Y) (superfamily II helicase)